MLLNGGLDMFSGIKRVPDTGVKKSCFFWLELAMIGCISVAGIGVSPFTSPVPARIFLASTVESWKPSEKMTSSAFAGRQSVLELQFGFRTRVIFCFAT